MTGHRALPTPVLTRHPDLRGGIDRPRRKRDAGRAPASAAALAPVVVELDRGAASDVLPTTPMKLRSVSQREGAV